MAMKPEDVKKLAENLKDKKAKVKPIAELPKDTKEMKLPKDVKQGIEGHFGVNLNKVRVHVGGNSKDVCKGLKTKAFTQGNHIYLAKIWDAKNSQLLAHELTHVIQQSSGKWPKPKDGKAFVSK